MTLDEELENDKKLMVQAAIAVGFKPVNDIDGYFICNKEQIMQLCIQVACAAMEQVER